jgi:hypothetical protein
MKKTRLSVGLIVATILVATILVFVQRDEAQVFGERVAESDFFGDGDPAVSFAEFIEPRLKDRLIERFKINTDDESIEKFMDEVAPELASSEKMRTDQENVDRLADALQAVADGTATPESAYERFDLSAAVDRASWQQMTSNDDIESVIQSMRQFADADTSSIRTMSRKSIRWIYINRRIFEAICDIPEIAEAIQAKIPTDASMNKQANSDESGIANFECSVHASKYISRELDENVTVRNSALSNYKVHIGLLNNVALDIANERM